jgi:hypothetical protein
MALPLEYFPLHCRCRIAESLSQIPRPRRCHPLSDRDTAKYRQRAQPAPNHHGTTRSLPRQLQQGATPGRGQAEGMEAEAEPWLMFLPIVLLGTVLIGAMVTSWSMMPESAEGKKSN